MANLITGIISITIGAVLLATVFINTIKGQSTNTSCYASNGSLLITGCSWSASEIAMWGLLSLIGIVGLLYGVLSVFGLA